MKIIDPLYWLSYNRSQFNLCVFIAMGSTCLIYDALYGFNSVLFTTYLMQTIVVSLSIVISDSIFNTLTYLEKKCFNNISTHKIIKLYKYVLVITTIISSYVAYSYTNQIIKYRPWDYGVKELEKAPSDQDLCGVYLPTSSSREIMKQDGFKIDSTSIEITIDHRYCFYNKPVAYLNFERSNSVAQQTLNGVWKNNCLNRSDCTIGLNGFSYELRKINNHFVILVTSSYSDSDRGIVYEKY